MVQYINNNSEYPVEFGNEASLNQRRIRPGTAVVCWGLSKHVAGIKVTSSPSDVSKDDCDEDELI